MANCGFSNCPNPKRTKGLCNAHYLQQWSGKPLTPLRVTRTVCTFEGCLQPHRSFGLCEAHYYQQRRGQNLKPVKTLTRRVKPVPNCEVHGCAAEAMSHYATMCTKHHTRVRRHGDPSTLNFNIMRGSANPTWVGERVGYTGAHDRVRKSRGHASGYQCVECGSAAAQWAYDHSCPDEKTSKMGPYSTDLSRYQPMCVSCHKLFDLERIGLRA
jgi:hypothetical protein